MNFTFTTPVVIRKFTDSKGVRHSVVEDRHGVADFIELDGHHADIVFPKRLPSTYSTYRSMMKQRAHLNP